MQHLSLNKMVDQSQQPRPRRNPRLLGLLLFLSLLIAFISVLCVAQLVIQMLFPESRVFPVGMMAGRDVSDLYSPWLDVPRIPAPPPNLVRAQEGSPTVGTAGPLAPVPVGVVDQNNQPSPRPTFTPSPTATTPPTRTPTATRQPATPTATTQIPSPTPQREATARVLEATELAAVEATRSAATATPPPVNTSTPIPASPTNTPVPTATLRPTIPPPTATTRTVEPPTPLPTNSPVPTATPRPTGTPQPPTVQFAQASFAINEGIGTVLITVNLSTAATSQVRVDYDAVSGSATASVDYNDLSGSLIFEPGQASASIPVTIIADTADEETEQFRIDLISASGANIGNIRSTTISITDDDDGSVVEFVTDSSQVTEAAGEVEVVIRLSEPSAFDISVPYSIVASGTTATSADYELPANRTIQVPSGQVNATLRLPIIDDALYEANETILLEIGKPQNGQLGEQINHLITIENNDSPPGINFELESQQVDENAGTATVKVQLDAPSGLEANVDFQLAGDAAGGGIDYRLLRNSLSFPAGSQEATLQIQIINDQLDELDETLELTLDMAQNATIGSRNRHRLQIVDDDDPPTLVFASDESSIREAAQPPLRSIELRLLNRDGAAQSSELTITVPFTISGSATRGDDYTLPNNLADGVLTIPAGARTARIDVTVVNDQLDELDFETVIITLGTPENAQLGNVRGHTLEIIDDDVPPQVTFAEANSTVVEDRDAPEPLTLVDVLVQLSAPSGREVRVPYSVLGSSTAVLTEDHQLRAGTLTFPQGSQALTITVPIVDDALDENAETLIIRLNPDNVTASTGVRREHTLTINDDDLPPEVSISPANITVDEGNQATLTVSLSAPSGRPVTVPFTVTDISTVGSGNYRDYAPITPASPIVFDPGETSLELTFSSREDQFYEEDETLRLRLTPQDGTASVGSLAEVEITIQNDDPRPTLSFESTAISVDEDSLAAVITVVLDGQTALGAEFVYSTLDGSTAPIATADVDYVSVPSQALSFPAPANPTVTRRTQTITVTLNDDNIDENDESFDIEITSTDPQLAEVASAGNIATVTIVDDDTAGFELINAVGRTTSESGAQAQFAIRLRSQPTDNVTIGLSSNDPSEGVVAPVSLIFTPLNWMTPQTVTVSGVNDAIDDGDQVYTIITAPASSSDPVYNGLDAPNVSITNFDDDQANVEIITVPGTTSSEAGGSFTIVFELTTEPTADVRINLSVSDTTEASLSAPSVTFTPANWTTPQQVLVTGLNDDIDDGDVNYTIITDPVVSGDPSYSGLNPIDINAVNQDDGDTAGLTINAGSMVTTEAGGTADFSLVLDSEPLFDVTIAISSSLTSEGTVAPASVVFTPANWDTPQTVTITGVDDFVDDGDRSFNIRIGPSASGDPNYDGLSSSIINVLNQDDDTVGVLAASLTGLTTDESGSTATFTMTLTSQPTATVTVNLISSDVSEGTITTPVTAALTFTPANWDIAQTVTVTGVNDAVADGDQLYNITVSSVGSADPSYNNLSVGLPVIAVTNTDDDTVGLNVTPVSGLVTSEVGTTASFEVSLNSQPLADVSVALSSSATGEGTVTTTPLIFTPTTWSISQTVTITGTDDTIYDGDVPYTIDLATSSTDTNYNGLAASVGVENLDNDTTELSINDPTVTEGNTGTTLVTFTVTLTTPSSSDTTVTFSTADDTATSSGGPGELDYTPRISDSVVIPAGDFSAEFAVEVVGDTVFEANEAFLVQLAAASDDKGAISINDAEGRATIENDDNVPQAGFSLSDYSIAEGAGTATITVTLNAVAGIPVAVDYWSEDITGGARAGDDYTAVTTNTLTFNPGEISRSFAVSIIQDDRGEPLEELALYADDGFGMLELATLAIIDDEPRINFSAPNYTVNEDDVAGEAVITATLTMTPTTPVTASYRIVGMSAAAGLDYSSDPADLSGVLTFNGTRVQTFTLPILNDLIGEPVEDIQLLLDTFSDNVWPGSTLPLEAELTIIDDEPRVEFTNSEFSIDETGGLATITIELSKTDPLTVTLVNYIITDDTATSPDDYTATSGSLIFAPGEISKTFQIPVRDDALGEGDELVELDLTVASSNAYRGWQNWADLRIIDDEPRISFSAGTFATNEGIATVNITVELDRVYTDTVEVDFATDTATFDSNPIAQPNPPDQDYIPNNGRLVIAPGNPPTATFTVQIVDDGADELDEWIGLLLSNPSGNASLDLDRAYIVIGDNDP